MPRLSERHRHKEPRIASNYQYPDLVNLLGDERIQLIQGPHLDSIDRNDDVTWADTCNLGRSRNLFYHQSSTQAAFF